MGNIFTVGPNEALVISGGICSSTKKSATIGGWAWAWWWICDVQTISLEVMTLNPRCDSVETAQGVPLTVTGVAQVKVVTQKDLLAKACEQFLGKTTQHMQKVLLLTLEGHLRAILGTLSVEAIYQDRDQFADMVRQVAAPDLARMGVEILTFTIKDVMDNVDYLNSLGRTQVAAVCRDADIGVAEANRDAGIVEAECDKSSMEVKYVCETRVADSRRGYELQQSIFNQEVNSEKAVAELSYSLQAARENQKIRGEEIQIEVVQRRKEIAIQEKEVSRKQKELDGSVRLPAEAEAFRITTVAEGERLRTVAEASAEAEAVRLIGESEGASIAAVGKAEAESMRLKAEAYRQYGDAAITAITLERLPQIAAEIAAPLANTGEIVIVSGDGGDNKLTKDITRLGATLPPTVQALTGVNLNQLIQQIASTS